METNRVKFRQELLKIMPGYKWTVHKPDKVYDNPVAHLHATGVQTAGVNRLSTLEVAKIMKAENKFEYRVSSAGYGLRAPYLAECTGPTLAKALRRLQDHYNAVASQYANHAASLEFGRKEA